jgi:hypothetical protein
MLTNLLPSCADCLKIWEPLYILRLSGSVQGLLALVAKRVKVFPPTYGTQNLLNCSTKASHWRITFTIYPNPWECV